MECLSDKAQQDRRMALSYMQEAQITAGLLASHGLAMKQESVDKHHHHARHHHHHPSVSPPLNNNTTAATASSLFSNMGAAAAAAASLSMLTPQQLLAASQMSHALMAAGLPVSLSPSLYHQTLFGGWPPTGASPPSPPLQAPLSPALSSKSSGQGSARRTPNGLHGAGNNNNNNNNNVVSSSADRLLTKKAQAAMKKKQQQQASNQPAAKTVKIEGAKQQQQLEAAAASPPSSISPEAGKDGRDKVFTCGVCSRSFGYKHVLQNHERTHTGEKPFKCPECHKRFTRDHHLKTHMRLHTGEKPYHCSHCDRQFVQVANLRRHLRVHTGERPYACELCSAKFSDSNQLKAHLLIHKNEKPFQCEHCLMRFRRRHHLVHHKCGASGLGAAPATTTTTTTTMLPGSLVSTELGSAASVACSDDLDNELDVDVEMDGGGEHKSLQRPSARLGVGPVLPLNLTSDTAPVLDLPEQTEPEDLSMPATRMRALDFRPQSRSHSSGVASPMSHSASSENAYEDEEDKLDVARASPSSLLFAPDARRAR